MFICGLLVAGGVHTVKSTAVRPAVTAFTGGLGNPVISVVEDVIAFGTSLLAVLAPILVLFSTLFIAGLVFWWLRQRRARTRYHP
jgi:hypothetical protein